MTWLSSTNITSFCWCECGTLKPKGIFPQGSDLFLLDYHILAYGLNASTWICFLWVEDTSHGHASPLAPCFLLLLTCHVVYMLHLVLLSWLGTGGHLFFIFGTLFLLLLWVSSLILDILVLLVLCFYLEWLRTLNG